MCLYVESTPYSYDYGAVELVEKSLGRVYSWHTIKNKPRQAETPYQKTPIPGDGLIVRSQTLQFDLEEHTELNGEAVHSFLPQMVTYDKHPSAYALCVLAWDEVTFMDVGSLALYIPICDLTAESDARYKAIQKLDASDWKGRWDRTKRFLKKWFPKHAKTLIEEYEDIEF